MKRRKNTAKGNKNGKKIFKTPACIIQGQGVINHIYTILCEQKIHFKKVLFLADKKTLTIGGNKIIELLKAKDILVIKKCIKKSDIKTVRIVEKVIRKQKPDLVIGFGGGKILDVAKLSAGNNRLRFISIPTILSNDGISSPVSVITDKNGIPVSHLTSPPFGIIIDFDIIKKAPLRHLRAGVGDLISNLSAVFDCRLAAKRKKERIDSQILKLAEIGAKRLLKTKTGNIKSLKFLESLCDGLLKSGLAMCLTGSSRPASGSEHKISHSMDYLFPGRDTLHGEQVGIATLFTMILQNNPYLKAVKRLYKNIKFPCRLSYVEISPAEFVQIVLYAKKIRPWRYTILEEKTLSEKIIKKFMKKVW
jgi:glycerol-1-phosphate dehydrogenase [NAD(P)+]